MSNYGRIRYVENYSEAPRSAKFIIRATCGDVVFEKYTDDVDVLAIFPSSVFYFKDEFKKMLMKCRELIGSNITIWCERPM